MMKGLIRYIVAVIAVMVVWTILEIVLHGVVLKEAYAATMELWRPEAEMKMGLMNVVRLIAAAGFVLIYAWLVGKKSVGAGIIYGVVLGITTGVGMGYGTYTVMPIPLSLAHAWFLGNVVITALGGLVTALIIKD